jgi:hypothetical protein
MSKLHPALLDTEPTILDQPVQIQGFQIITIKLGLKALQQGMMMTRGANAKYLLTLLSKYTGKTYKPRKDVQQGIDDCEELLRLIKG